VRYVADEWRERAEVTFDAITSPRLLDAKRHVFGTRRHVLLVGSRSYEHLWPFAGAMSAVETLATLDGQKSARRHSSALVDGLDAYRSGDAFASSVGPPLGRGGEVYYDDNAWVALALLHRHEREQDERSLALASGVLRFLVTGWTPDASWQRPGGIRWKVSTTSRNTCSNAPAAEVAALVHRHTGDPTSLDWAARIYDWVCGALRGPDDLYRDRIAPEGTVVPDIWTYNQGTMIGAGVLLAASTGDRRYLDDAHATAASALRRFDLSTLLRPNGPAFNAVFFRNLFMLEGGDLGHEARAMAETYGEAMWREHRDQRTGFFRTGGSPLNGAAPMMEIYALLAGASAHA
jgi:hypothetical protein